MPSRVAQVRWRCPQCKKSKWLKPWLARQAKFCSRSCAVAAMRVDKPVRPKRSAVSVVGQRNCARCESVFDVTTLGRSRKYCSRACALRAVHERNKRHERVEVACLKCGAAFIPRPGNAAKFCSRACHLSHQSGPLSPLYKGGRHVTADGYARVLIDGANRYESEHRVVMAGVLGRPLRPEETVHHINGKKDDNRPENLELWVSRHCRGQRVADLVEFALGILADYAPERLR